MEGGVGNKAINSFTFTFFLYYSYMPSVS